jgi:hypothetical protein
VFDNAMFVFGGKGEEDEKGPNGGMAQFLPHAMFRPGCYLDDLWWGSAGRPYETRVETAWN